jgi:hypothetical protein
VTDESDPDDIDLGTPGASARREHARRRANRERRTRDRHPRIGGLLLALRDEPQDELAWGRGALGEEVVAKELARYVNNDVTVLHDRRVPGTRANIDHIAIAPSGVWVIDTKRYKGKVAVNRPLFGSSKLTIAGRDKSELCAGLAKQVALVAPAVAEVVPAAPVRGAMCFVDAELPLLRTLTFDDLPMLNPKRLAKRINAAGPLTPDVCRQLRTALAARFSPA